MQKRSSVIRDDLRYRRSSFRLWWQRIGLKLLDRLVLQYTLVLLMLAVVFCPSIRQWSNENQGAMTAAAALVAALFALFNFDLVRQGRENLYTTQDQAYTQFMPVAHG